MDITEGRLGPVAALSGEVDLAAAEAVEERIRTTLADEPDVLVLDLRAVEFLDSSGLRVVLSLDKASATAVPAWWWCAAAAGSRG